MRETRGEHAYQEVSIPKVCRGCRHATERPGHTRMYRLGFRNCAHQPDWVFVVGGGACRLNPVRFEAKPG